MKRKKIDYIITGLVAFIIGYSYNLSKVMCFFLVILLILILVGYGNAD